MELTVVERIMLLDVLPAESDVTTLRIVRTLREALSFSEQEHADLGLTTGGGKVTWNSEKATLKDVEIGAKAHSVIAAALQRRSNEKKLTIDMVGLYERFVEEKKES